MIFLDTSAIYALADAADPNHRRARERLETVLAEGEEILTHSYVLVEAAALLQNRLGTAIALEFSEEARSFTIEWVGETLHWAAIRKLEASPRRQLSLVDQVSFLVMRARGVVRALAFDRHFRDEGFET